MHFGLELGSNVCSKVFYALPRERRAHFRSAKSVDESPFLNLVS